MSNDLRVVIASRIWAPEPAAAVFRLGALRRALLEAGAKVRVLTAAKPEKLADVACDERGVSRARVLRNADGYIAGFVPYLSFDLPLFFRLCAVQKPDVVVSELPPTTGSIVRLVCKLRRIPYVYYAADLWEDAAQASGYPPIAQRFIGWLERKVLAGAAKTLAVSAHIEDAVNERGGKAELVQNGVDTERFCPQGESHDFGVPTFVYAGTVGDLQGAVIFAKAFARVLPDFPTARLVFHAKGEELPEIEQILSDLPAANWEINGLVHPDQIAIKLRGAVASLASIAPGSYDFAVPSKSYAAAACGTRVLRVGKVDPASWPELLGPVCPYDLDAVEAAMRQLLTEEDTGRAERAQWVADHASLNSVGRAAAAAVLAVARG